MYDLILTGGTVVTGDGSEPFEGDVAVQKDKIALVAPHICAPAARKIDARGLCVGPGFIDMHCHSDITLMANPQADSMLMQGVTTQVTGNCGLTAFPLPDDERRKSLSFIDVPGTVWDWKTAGEFEARLAAAGPAINTAQLAGHGGIRAAVVGYENRRATPAELTKMQRLLADMLEEGLFGLSTGLGYAPDFYSDTDELCALAEVIRQYDRFFAFHVRGERATLFKAVAEAIEVSRRTHASVEVSHLKCADAMNMGRMGELLGLFDKAMQEGLPVHFDQYPYTAGNSYLGLVFPPWAHEGGMDRLLERLGDAALRPRLEREMHEGCAGWSSMLAAQGGANILFTEVGGAPGHPLEGRCLADIAAEWGVSAERAACEIMLSARGRAEMVMHQQKEEDLELAMRHPLGMFGSDGFAMDTGAKIPKGAHPRSFGTFARVYSRYVREKGVLTLAQAVRRMTGASAQKLHLGDRGLLEAGRCADITVFSPDKICDTATYAQPKRYAQGVEWVFVNGAAAKTPEGLTGVCAGRVLRREGKK